jgi:hypothetical protein
MNYTSLFGAQIHKIVTVQTVIQRMVLWLGATMLLLLFTACPQIEPAKITDLVVVTSPVLVASAGQSTLSASVSGTGAFDRGITWQLLSDGGKLSATTGPEVVLTAPNGPTTVVVRASASGDSRIQRTVTVMVQAPLPTITAVTIRAIPVLLNIGQKSALEATVTGTGAFNSAVTWRIVSGPGQLSSTTSNPTDFQSTNAGMVVVEATAVADPSQRATVSLTVQAATPTITGVTIKATPATLLTGQSASLEAAVTGTGAFNPAVTWRIMSGPGQLSSTTSNPTNLQTAASDPAGTVVVEAVAVADPNRRATVNLTVAKPPITGRWQPTNPGGGGAFNSPVIGPTGVWAVGSDLGGLWLSSDQGQSWRALGAAAGLTNTHVASLAFHPDGRLLIGTEHGIYTLDQAGQTVTQRWSQANSSVMCANSLCYTSALLVSSDPQVVYAAIQPGYDALSPFLLRSNNGGTTWQQVGGSGLPANLRVVALRSHPTDPDTIIVVAGKGRWPIDTGPQQAWRSSNQGKDFTQLATALGNIYDVAYSYNPDNLNEIYLTTATQTTNSMGWVNSLGGGLHRSIDNGSNWGIINANQTGAIILDRTNNQHIRLAEMRDATFDVRQAKHGIWESLNGGNSFSQISNYTNWQSNWSKFALDSNAVGSSYQGLLQTFGSDLSGQNIIWTNSQFVHASSDGGRSFKQAVSKAIGSAWLSTGIDNAVPVVVAPSPANPNLVYVGYRDLGLWRSDTGGQSWVYLRGNPAAYATQWGGGAYGGNSFTVLPDPTRENVVWAQLGGDPRSLSGNSANPSPLLHRSTDKGATWSVVAGIPSNANAISGLSLDPSSPSNARVLYVVVDGMIYKSSDDGQNWQPRSTCSGCFFTYVLGQQVFAGGSGGLRRSSDAGQSWQQSSGLPNSMSNDWWWSAYQGISDLAILPNSSLWAAVFGYGFYQSTDGGNTWIQRVADQYARTVTTDGTKLLIGSSSAFNSGGYSPNSQGMRVSTDNGNTWQSSNDGLAYPFAVQIRVAGDGVTWLLSPGQGVMRR